MKKVILLSIGLWCISFEMAAHEKCHRYGVAHKSRISLRKNVPPHERTQWELLTGMWQALCEEWRHTHGWHRN